MKKALALIAATAPVAALAQTSDELREQYGAMAAVAQLLISIGGIVRLLIPIVVSVALLMFFWGIAKFIANAGDETAQAKGKRLMVGGVIGFVVMLSIWGIVSFIQSALGIGGVSNVQIPTSSIPQQPQP